MAENEGVVRYRRRSFRRKRGYRSVAVFRYDVQKSGIYKRFCAKSGKRRVRPECRRTYARRAGNKRTCRAERRRRMDCGNDFTVLHATLRRFQLRRPGGIARTAYGMPAKNKTNLAKTPLFSRFLSNSRLKYVRYVCARLYQKSSKISTFWLLASLTADFQTKTRHANGLIPDV